MLDTDGAVGQNIGTVDYCTFEFIVLISSELLKHFNLVDDCVDQVLILCIGCIVWIQWHCHVESLFGQSYFAEGQVCLKQSFVYSWERSIKSDSSLTVFDGFSVHFQADIAHCSIGKDLDAWLDVARLSVESDRWTVILSTERLVTLYLFRFSLRVCGLNHFWLSSVICFKF